MCCLVLRENNASIHCGNCLIGLAIVAYSDILGAPNKQPGFQSCSSARTYAIIGAVRQVL